MRQVVAERYARAFFELAEETDSLDQLHAELMDVFEVLRSQADLRKILEHPLIPGAEKKSLLARIFPKASQNLSNFLFLLVDRRRIDFLPEICALFSKLFHEKRQKLVAEVTTARPLDEIQSQTLRERLEAAYRQEVTLETRIDPAVLGGVRVRIGDQILDGTLGWRLETLRQHLSQMKDGGTL